MTLRDKKAKMKAIVADWQARGIRQLMDAQLHNFKVGTLSVFYLDKYRFPSLI